ncbi:MAG: methyltransferase domain-containing protein [Nitrospiraceae bacterium]
MKAARSTGYHTTSRVVAQTLETYDREARVFLTRWGKPRYKRPALLVEWLSLLPQRAILLDLGCGGGQDARYLKAAGYRVIGLDRTLPLLRFGKTRVSSLPLVLADMRFLPLHSGRLEGIWAAASLMHLPKPAAGQVFLELHRLMGPGGLLAATLTYGTRSRILERGWLPGRYFARWRKAELANALRHAGWEIVMLRVVTNQERKGLWLNLVARRPFS